ncbi:hypothetical protein OE88DRAFT_480662 [Heliocybe sulcata]|uniref:Uncharacterized protein n=1 Tax=Heliocybe sulcata TaxID=5364 RepID=A0A5C3MSY3_9AGAM|nr:hypothetical protein OE88DRAFT_480662 [Heliocybe sulcata]
MFILYNSPEAAAFTRVLLYFLRHPPRGLREVAQFKHNKESFSHVVYGEFSPLDAIILTFLPIEQINGAVSLQIEVERHMKVVDGDEKAKYYEDDCMQCLQVKQGDHVDDAVYSGAFDAVAVPSGYGSDIALTDIVVTPREVRRIYHGKGSCW